METLAISIIAITALLLSMRLCILVVDKSVEGELSANWLLLPAIISALYLLMK